MTVLVKDKHYDGLDTAEIEEAGDGFFLCLSVNEMDETLFSLRLYVADKIQAQTMRGRFLTDPAALLDALTAVLL